MLLLRLGALFPSSSLDLRLSSRLLHLPVCSFLLCEREPKPRSLARSLAVGARSIQDQPTRGLRRDRNRNRRAGRIDMANAGGGAAGEGEWLKVAQLRALVQAQDPRAKEVDNLTLRRFLRARDHYVDKAGAMLLKFLRWRAEAAPGGSVPEEAVRGELEQDKVYMGGVDRTGRPIIVGFLAKHYSANRDMAEFKSFVVYFFDKICARIPRGQEKYLAIMDLKGWGYANCDVRAYIAAIEIMQNYYPERLGKALMINVPYIFLKVWKTMVYPFIDANTRDKFVFVEDKSLRETLRRDIDETQLPEFLGGKMPLVSLKDYAAQQPQPVCEC